MTRTDQTNQGAQGVQVARQRPKNMPGDTGVIVVYAIAIFLCAALGGGIPLFMHERLQSRLLQKCVVLGTIFGGGVFIAAGFVHLLADAAKELDAGEDAFPIAELLCAIGVLVPLCIDSMASTFAMRAQQLARGRTLKAAAAAMSAGAQPEARISTNGRPNMRTDVDSLVSSIVLFDAHEPSPVSVVEDDASSSAPDHAPARAHPASAHPTQSRGSRGRGRSAVVSIVGTCVLFLALTMHSFIAGLVLGVGSELETGVFIAIIAHKSFAAWALGCALARTDRSKLSTRTAWLCLGGFAITTPVGIFIGMALSSAEWVDGRAQKMLTALAAGFFLYVGLMEVVAKEVVDYHTTGSGVFSFLKLVTLVLGFSLMTLLRLWV